MKKNKKYCEYIAEAVIRGELNEQDVHLALHLGSTTQLSYRNNRICKFIKKINNETTIRDNSFGYGEASGFKESKKTTNRNRKKKNPDEAKTS